MLIPMKDECRGSFDDDRGPGQGWVLAHEAPGADAERREGGAAATTRLTSRDPPGLSRLPGRQWLYRRPFGTAGCMRPQGDGFHRGVEVVSIALGVRPIETTLDVVGQIDGGDRDGQRVLLARVA